jgi:hypothetical protein
VAARDPDRKLLYTIGLCLFASTFAIYAPVVHHEFVNYDDLHLIVYNPKLTRAATLSNLLVHFYEPITSNYLPLYWISMQLGFAVHGADPAAFLLTNVFIHATSSVFLFAALRRLTGSVWRSVFVAAVFALHPLHVESVAWVVERKDVLAGLFWMLGLYAYSRYTESPRSTTRYLAVLLCLALGLLSKSTLVTFPAVLILLDIWPLDRLRGETRRVLLEKVPMFILVAVASGATLLAQEAAGNFAPSAGMGVGSRIANAIESYWNYSFDAVWPAGLGVLYPHPYLLAPVSGRAAIVAVGLGIALVGSTVLILMASRKRPYLGVGWLWYLGTLVPMIGLVQVGTQARADRYMYLPLAGLSILFAWGVADLVAAKRREFFAALAVAVLMAFALVTRSQLDHWENSIALFERAIAVSERNRYAHERLAYELLQIGRPEEARQHYRTAISIEPTHAPLYYGLAVSYEDSGDYESAIAAYRNALRQQPGMVLAHGSLGLLLLQEGHPAAAKGHLFAATRAMPDSIEYRDALAAARSATSTPTPATPAEQSDAGRSE